MLGNPHHAKHVFDITSRPEIPDPRPWEQPPDVTLPSNASHIQLDQSGDGGMLESTEGILVDRRKKDSAEGFLEGFGGSIGSGDPCRQEFLLGDRRDRCIKGGSITGDCCITFSARNNS
jgi:hypothetical protein